MRVQAEQVAEILGIKARTVRHLAQRGELPSAAKIGTVWTFDRKTVEAWLHRKEQEAARCPTISTRGTGFGMADIGLTAKTAEEAYEQAVSQKRSNG